ncbi:MAG: hypothetical protein WA979_00570 [Pacificimonas sp.]
MIEGSASVGLKVTPPVPSGHSPKIPANELIETISDYSLDDASGWATYIIYKNAKGEISERRISCRKLSGYGNPELVGAICHETSSYRTFRIDRIIDLIDLRTGEVGDPHAHFLSLWTNGVFKTEDKTLSELAKLLVFLARCDGDFHPLEDAAIEDAIARYCIRFGGNDNVIETVMTDCRALAPCEDTFRRSILKLSENQKCDKLARLVLDSMNHVMDADGQQNSDEFEWALRATHELKRIAMRS